jgi:hypothetical protein
MIKKSIFYFKIEKNLTKGGGWLVTVQVKHPNVPNNGEIVACSAWTSVAPAKRWCAGMVARKSIRWKVSEDKSLLTAEVEVRQDNILI